MNGMILGSCVNAGIRYRRSRHSKHKSYIPSRPDPKSCFVKTSLGLALGPMCWVGPPPTNSDILGIYTDPTIVTITPCG